MGITEQSARMLSKYVSAAIAVLALPAATIAGQSSTLKTRQSDSYCPGFEVTDAERLEIFNGMNELLFHAANSDDASAVEDAFATFYSPDLIEHTAASDSYASDVKFLSALARYNGRARGWSQWLLQKHEG